MAAEGSGRGREHRGCLKMVKHLPALLSSGCNHPTFAPVEDGVKNESFCDIGDNDVDEPH